MANPTLICVYNSAASLYNSEGVVQETNNFALQFWEMYPVVNATII